MVYPAICAECGKAFKLEQKKRAQNPNVCCSLKCSTTRRHKLGLMKISPVFTKTQKRFKKGIRASPKTEFKRGSPPEKHWNWKGGITPLNKKLRLSLEWKIWRNKVFERDNWNCQNCKRRAVLLHPHHIVPVKDCLKTGRKDLVFDVNNGVTLCKECHMALHGLNKRGE